MATHASRHSDVSLSLVLAVIASSSAPLLLLDGDLTVIAASASFCVAFQVDPDKVTDRPISDLGGGEWNLPRLKSLLQATAAGHAEIEAYEIDLRAPGGENRRLVLNAQKLNYADSDSIRVLLSVTDVTDARLAETLKQNLIREKDEALREKAVLLQELQHRVANSLQIIASVLLQSARRVQSDESRAHLHEAHQRVMSVAALQKQLAGSTADDVELRGYFTDLCQSIGASMIRDHNQISLEVTADESVTRADISVSLGLIVTELVINALKHAFPDERSGKINVDYHGTGADWKLSVEDDGVGMSKNPAASSSGLGTSIIRALARQLKAVIEVTDNDPGTLVSVEHKEVPAAGDAIAPPPERAV